MSAFLVHDNHLHAICTFASGLKSKGYSIPEVGDLFVAFKSANLLALRDRYGDPAEPAGKPKPKQVVVPPVALLKACQCLEYQCSDWTGWNDSAAKKYLGVVQSAAVMALPGYEEAAWAIV